MYGAPTAGEIAWGETYRFQQQCRRFAREDRPTQAVVVSLRPEGRA